MKRDMTESNNKVSLVKNALFLLETQNLKVRVDFDTKYPRLSHYHNHYSVEITARTCFPLLDKNLKWRIEFY